MKSVIISLESYNSRNKEGSKYPSRPLTPSKTIFFSRHPGREKVSRRSRPSYRQQNPTQSDEVTRRHCSSAASLRICFVSRKADSAETVVEPFPAGLWMTLGQLKCAAAKASN